MVSPEDDSDDSPAAPVVIVGGGIVGLVLALALKKQLGVTPHVYEKVSGYAPDVGAGMGMYPNGLRVIRDIHEDLLKEIRSNGYPYVFRRWERHDGTQVAVSEEKVLCRDEPELQSLGIRRWKLQQALYEHLQEQKIPIHFGKKLNGLVQDESTPGNQVRLTFDDGTVQRAKLVFGADGSKSKVRSLVLKQQEDLETPSKLAYTGITCVMGMADCPDPSIERGISFPSSLTTKCHGCFFPTSPNQQCFQMHFPVEKEDADPGNWGTLSQAVGEEECHKLKALMEEGGWDDKFTTPLQHVTHAVRVGFCALKPALPHWVYLNNRVVLCGDAAHPPVPYTGQGAQMGLEDAGTLALLLKEFCLAVDGELDLSKGSLSPALKVYEQLRIPRTLEINKLSKSWGETQQKRAHGEKYNQVKEELIRREVFYHETMPVMIPGATYNYRAAIEQYLSSEPKHMPIVREE